VNEIINCQQVDFRYDRDPVLKGFTFQVQRGEVVALLGPNGAGKTTSVRVMNGLLPLEGGSVKVFDMPAYERGAEIRRRTGVLTETPALYERLTALQNLRFFGTLAGLGADELDARIKLMLDVFGLANREGDRVDTYSKGMKQRLAIARAMLHNPELLFLDEPTSDLDPEAARQVADTIREVSAHNNRTVILCTHRLFEAEQICDRVAVMSSGQVKAIGSLDELRRAVLPNTSVRFKISAPFSREEMNWLARHEGITAVHALAEDEMALDMPDADAVSAVVAYFVHKGASILAVEPRKASLEDIYLHLQQTDRKAAE
jgi:ABC-2 type transport system ATP-binding protein